MKSNSLKKAFKTVTNLLKQVATILCALLLMRESIAYSYHINHRKKSEMIGN